MRISHHDWITESISLDDTLLGCPSTVHGVFPEGPIGIVDTYCKIVNINFQHSCKNKSITSTVAGPDHINTRMNP
ncbi:hypothetical protein BCR42DRAFT_428367 [Absidia repens]|uniref:Uncharacterized protein n=1 Tax=Absidia repens TaxID=90262 RepID=A0A1X2HYQ5_9FUNG|nr:hypothetical protein BCR42DRAFT_428367 [Absidia repens]